MMANQFKDRSGCLDYGTSYEFLLAAYYGLKLSFNNSIADFKLSVNNKDFGVFDDLIIEMQHGDQQYIHALQLKHRGKKEDNITLARFEDEKGNFAVVKYCNSFEEIRENLSDNIPFENCFFILFTNQVLRNFYTYDEHKKEIECDLIKLKSDLVIYKYDKCVAQGLLDLSEAENFFIFRFQDNKNNLNKDFLKQFFLYTKQKDAQELECMISSFIYNHFKNCDPNVVTNYIDFFKYWWRGDFGIYKLSKQDIIGKLVEFVLTPYISNDVRELKSEPYDDLFKKCFHSFDLTISSNEDFFNRLFGAEMRTTEARKRYILLWQTGKVPLCVKVQKTCKKVVYAAINLCHNLVHRKKFILLDNEFDKNAFGKEVKIFETLSDLARFDYYIVITEAMKFSIQGRSFVQICKLLEMGDVAKFIKVDDIIQIVNTGYTFGKKQHLSKHYVTRLIPKIFLSDEVIDKVENDIFVIIYDKNRKLQIKQSNRSIVLIESEWAEEVFSSICQLNKEKNCHFLRATKPDIFEWVQSNGTVEHLRPYQINYENIDGSDSLEDLQVLSHFKSKINLLCAVAGMGKTTTLQFLKTCCFSFDFVSVISLNDFIYFLKDSDGMDSIRCYLFTTECGSELDKEIMKVFLSNKRVIFLWDGFDEIPKIYEEKVTSLIQLLSSEGFYQWIAARSTSRKYLEDTFGLFALNLKEFSDKDQKKFIFNYLMEKYNDARIVEDLVIKLEKLLASFKHSGVPLQMHMLLEIFLKHPEQYLEGNKVVTLLDIYKEFINGKFMLFFERANAASNPIMAKIQKKYQENKLQQYEFAALKATLDPDTFCSLEINCEEFLQDTLNNGDSLGLIVGFNGDMKPVFAHKTFEEFLAASWLVRNKKLLEILEQEEYKGVRLMCKVIQTNNKS